MSNGPVVLNVKTMCVGIYRTKNVSTIMNDKVAIVSAAVFTIVVRCLVRSENSIAGARNANGITLSKVEGDIGVIVECLDAVSCTDKSITTLETMRPRKACNYTGKIKPQLFALVGIEECRLIGCKVRKTC